MRQRIIIALVVTVALGIIGAAAYFEAPNTSTATTMTTTTTTLPPTATSSTTTTSTATTTTAASTTSSPIPRTTPPPPEPGIINVVVSSGSAAGERVQPTVFFMSVAGYVNIRGVEGSVTLVNSVVYYADGFQAAAEVFAVDAGLSATDVAPLDEAPPVPGLGSPDLLLYLGGS